jgi:hypothetical protein
MAEVNGKRRMLQTQRLYKVCSQFLVVLFRHWFDLLVLTIFVSSACRAGCVNVQSYPIPVTDWQPGMSGVSVYRELQQMVIQIA